MKKIITCFSICFILSLSFIFTGCNNENKTLARNLDDTITNLVYSVSSLDWADSTMLNNLNNTNQNFNINYFDSSTNLNNLAVSEEPSATLDQDTNNTITNPEDNINQDDSAINPDDNISQDDATNPNNTETPEEPIEDNELENNFPHHPHNRFPMHHRHRRPPFNNNQNYPLPPEDIETNTNNKTPNNYNTNSNMSGFNRYRPRMSRNKISKINNQTFNTTNNQKTLTNTTSSTSQNNNIMMVTYSTQNIEDSASRVQEKISELINKRANVLLYINDLYKGYVSLNEESIKAVNAYINIIKDNTSYLNTNKGMINNQITQATEIAAANSTSPLINAYIIRTNEAIETRLTKLDSSILAIDSICDIMQASLTESSPNFNQNTNILNNENNSNLNTLNSENFINNQTRLSLSNENLNNQARLSTNTNNNLTNNLDNNITNSPIIQNKKYKISKNAKNNLNNVKNNPNIDNLNNLNKNNTANNIITTEDLNNTNNKLSINFTEENPNLTITEKQLLNQNNKLVSENNTPCIDCNPETRTSKYSITTNSLEACPECNNTEKLNLTTETKESSDETNTENCLICNDGEYKEECIICEDNESCTDCKNIENCLDCKENENIQNEKSIKEIKTNKTTISSKETSNETTKENDKLEEIVETSLMCFIDKNHSDKINKTRTRRTNSSPQNGYVVNNHEIAKTMPYKTSSIENLTYTAFN